MLRVLEKLLGRGDDRVWRRYLPVVERVNALESEFERLSDEALPVEADAYASYAESKKVPPPLPGPAMASPPPVIAPTPTSLPAVPTGSK